MFFLVFNVFSLINRDYFKLKGILGTIIYCYCRFAYTNIFTSILLFVILSPQWLVDGFVMINIVVL